MGSIIIHGHFYQPPRENPWAGVVDRERSALPFHDWNERIYAECYRPNAFARITDNRGRIERIVNNYAHISFNFGPTLLNWLEGAHPDTYARILAADRESVRNHQGHGNAIAQGYNHAILPLCNERDRITQIRWGIADFYHRFGRLPESLWLPETACNDLTLGTMIDAGLLYAILSPTQAKRVRPLGAGEWQDVSNGSIDPHRSYRYLHRDGSGRSIVIFFYDPGVSLAIAFEGALAWSSNLVDRLVRALEGEEEMVNVATDGESYGHHFPFGDRCLAYSLAVEAPSRGLYLTNYAEFLANHPPRDEVEIISGPDGEGTAWSCQHGVGRWYRDCGCQTGGGEGWNQRWRGPLRSALDLLRDEAARQFEDLGGDLFRDPWAARDAYIEVIRNPSLDFRNEFLDRHAKGHLDEAARTRALIMLEAQRAAMLMYTSCGWFFADISRIESVQVMKYAGRVLDFMEDLGAVTPITRFLELLAEAKSNIPAMGNGADVYRRFVQPQRATPSRVAAHLAISSIADGSHEGRVGDYLFYKRDFERRQRGRLTLTTGCILLKASSTGMQRDCAVAALHTGGLDFYCALRAYAGTEHFKHAVERLQERFRSASLPAMLRLMQREFGPEEFGLEAVLPGGRRAILQMVFRDTFEGFASQLARLYEENRRFLALLNEAGFEPTTQLRQVAELALQHRFEQELLERRSSRDPAAYGNALEIAQEVARWNYRIDKSRGNSVLSALIAEAARDAVSEPSPDKVESAVGLVRLANGLALEPNLDLAQEAVYIALVSGAPGAKRLTLLAAALNISPEVNRN
jgi:alpha-amylase/alpha-mannosidase (GH57 family)